MKLIALPLAWYWRLLKRVANHPGIALGVFFGSWILFALAFMGLEGHSLRDSLYWSSTTVSTVGYGDISPVTDPGKDFTMFVQFYSILVTVPLAITTVVENAKVNKKELTHAEQEYMLKYIEMDAAAKGYDLGPQPEDYDA